MNGCIFLAGALRDAVTAARPEVVCAEGPTPHREEAPLLPETHPVYGETVRAVASLERQVLEAPLAGIVLRYGLFYGPGTGFDAPIAPGSVHVDAAAREAALAVSKGSPGIYNVAEADGTVTTDRAVRELGWAPGFRLGPTWPRDSRSAT